MVNPGFYVYILLCNDGSYYTGHTDDLEKRIAEHKFGGYSKYTSRRLPVTLIYSELFQTRDEAFAIERKIKGWNRMKKEILMSGNIESLRNLK